MKDLLKKYCDKFEKHLEINKKLGRIEFNKESKVELFSGLKPASYHVSSILDYIKHPPYSKEPNKPNPLAWFVEIWIDGVCVWRKFKLNETGENLHQYEDELINQVMIEIFFIGMFNSWDFIKKREADKNKFSNGNKRNDES